MNCKNIDFGSYKHSLKVKIPPYYSKQAKKQKPHIFIDKCILEEIKYLWEKGIKTGGCCCGHGKIKPSVSIWEESINDMLRLGYKQDEQYKEGHVFYLRGLNETKRKLS
jgi:hypothetical protein